MIESLCSMWLHRLFVTSQLKFEENMKVNMNIIVGGTDDILDNILFATRTVRKEMKKLLKALR